MGNPLSGGVKYTEYEFFLQFRAKISLYCKRYKVGPRLLWIVIGSLKYQIVSNFWTPTYDHMFDLE